MELCKFQTKLFQYFSLLVSRWKMAFYKFFNNNYCQICIFIFLPLKQIYFSMLSGLQNILISNIFPINYILRM